MSELNNRRHGRDLHIADKDLLTGRDARRLIRQEFEAFLAAEAERRAAEIREHNARPWWRRLLYAIQRREAA